MSLKNDNPASRPAVRSGRFSQSLAFRLAITGAGASSAILAAICLITYFGVAAHLRSLNHDFLFDELTYLKILVRSPDYRRQVAVESVSDSAGEDYVKHYMRLRLPTGETVCETQGMKDLLPPAVFPTATQGVPRENDRIWISPDGSAYLLTAAWVDLGKAGGETGILQAALDVTNVETILAALRTRLLWTFGVGILLCLGAGFAVARQGTRPLKAIREKVREITATNLHQRVNGAEWPRELSTLAETLNSMFDRLHDSFARLTESAMNLVHEVRTPLTILRGEAELALVEGRSEEELREVLASSLEEYDRISRLSDNILFLARSETGKIRAVVEKMTPSAEVEKVVEYYAPLAEEKELSVTVRGEDFSFPADPVLLRRAVANVVANAITYSEQKGEVSVCTTSEGGRLIIEVVDKGCGISAEDRKRIFDFFYRVPDSRQNDSAGSGLGLAVVRSIMDLHGGTVDIGSTPGAGTTVRLTFPPERRHSASEPSR